MKRGQTTIFIILSIVIIAVVVVLIFVINNKEKTVDDYFLSSEVKAMMDSLIVEVQGCAEETSINALDTIGFQGGYYNKPEKAFEVSDPDELEILDFIPYYYYEGQILVPTRNNVENELSKAIDSELRDCLDNIDSELDFSYGNSKSLVEIKDKEVIITIKQDIKIQREEHTTTYRLEDNPIVLESGLKDILELADYMTESRKEEPNKDCVSCIADVAEEKNLYIEVTNFDEVTTLVTIYEEYTEQQQLLMFLNKFKEEDL
ncbi:MAG: hypothetical protein ABIH37_02945 [archaeon]